MATTAEIVNNVWENAKTSASTFKSEASSNLANAISAAGSNAPSAQASSLSFYPDIVEPQVNIPANAEAAGFQQFKDIWDETINYLVNKFKEFIIEYFPDETQYINEAQVWLYNTIKNGGTGLPINIENQIWQRERARILIDANRNENELIETWAARGFPLPPGALVHAMAMSKQDTQNKIADSSSKIAIAQAELEQKNIQFAVENAVKLWTGAMDAAGNYIKAIATGPNSAGQVIPSITDSQAKLISAASDYYKARIAVQELRLKANLIPAQWVQDVNIKNADLVMQYIKEKVNAAVEAAKIAGTIASSALNSLHASAGLQSAYGVNFQYHGEIADPANPG